MYIVKTHQSDETFNKYGCIYVDARYEILYPFEMIQKYFFHYLFMRDEWFGKF